MATPYDHPNSLHSTEISNLEKKLLTATRLTTKQTDNNKQIVQKSNNINCNIVNVTTSNSIIDIVK